MHQHSWTGQLQLEFGSCDYGESRHLLNTLHQPLGRKPNCI
jgi:hypothetical protein